MVESNQSLRHIHLYILPVANHGAMENPQVKHDCPMNISISRVFYRGISHVAGNSDLDEPEKPTSIGSMKTGSLMSTMDNGPGAEMGWM